MSSSDPTRHFSLEDIEQLKRSTFVRDVDHHTTLASTNSHAIGRANDPLLKLPSLILADHQTSGRGRGAHQWWSARGSLTFSLILDRPESFEAASWPRVALTTGIAVCDALHQVCPALDAALKWPNDVYVCSRKIGGILVEIPPQANRRVVIGVGCNVNNAIAEAPTSLHQSATSLIDVTGYPFPLAQVLISILNQLFAHLTLLQRDPIELQQRWDLVCMLTGKNIQIATGSRQLAGICRGINRQGALLVESTSGVHVCSSGDVVSWE